MGLRRNSTDTLVSSQMGNLPHNLALNTRLPTKRNPNRTTKNPTLTKSADHQPLLRLQSNSNKRNTSRTLLVRTRHLHNQPNWTTKTSQNQPRSLSRHPRSPAQHRKSTSIPRHRNHRKLATHQNLVPNNHSNIPIRRHTRRRNKPNPHHNTTLLYT